MKKAITKSTSNFFTENKDLLIAGGTIITLVGAGFTWYYFQKKKKQKQMTLTGSKQSTAVSQNTTTSSKVAVRSVSKRSASSTGKSGYPIKYGSRHPDVKILQRYLKIYKEDLGTSGARRDGVDGIFGPKTARASKKRLGKSVFTTSDINGMRNALKAMGK